LGERPLFLEDDDREHDLVRYLSHTKSCEILSARCAVFPDASIDEQLGMIALPIGDRSVGNERAGCNSSILDNVGGSHSSAIS